MTQKASGNRSFRQKPMVLQGDYHADPVLELKAVDMEIMHLPERLWTQRMADLFNDPKLYGVIKRFVEGLPGTMRPVNDEQPSIFTFFGSLNSMAEAGAGIMLKAARSHRFKTLYLDVARISDYWRTKTLTADEDQTFEERAYETDLLFLSGLGSESQKSFVQDVIFSLLKHRQMERLVTVATTTLSPKELTNFYRGGVFDLLNLSAVIVRCE